MHSRARRFLFILVAAALLAACNKVPDNARYIPADAVAAVGINLKSLSKKIAWNLITGSKLFKEIQRRMPAKNAGDAVGGIENAGFDVANTFYVYTRSDNRFAGGNLLAGLVPLSNAANWEAYVKMVFPNVEIIQREGRKEAALGEGMYVAWNTNLLIIINASIDDENLPEGENAAAMIMAEMDRAFLVPVQNPIVDNKRFADYEKDGHDLTFWLNYGKLLSSYTGGVDVDVNGISLSSSAWKDAIITSGFDFKKGKIVGDVNYYMPQQLEDNTKGFGTIDADKDMLDRMPNNSLDMLLSMHISPGAVRTLMEKLGLFGITNVALTAHDLDVDYVLDAFTGDMAIGMNDFSLYTEMKQDSFIGQIVSHKEQKAEMSMTYVVKINKEENFKKLLEFANVGGMQRTANGYAMPLTYKDSVHLMMDKQYAVISSKKEYAEGVLDGRFRKKGMPKVVAKKVYGYPFALCLDIRQLFKDVDPAISNSPRDSAVIAESKKLLDNISLNGGKFEDNAYKFNLEINFMNTDENSILELIDFGMRMNDISSVFSR